MNIRKIAIQVRGKDITGRRCGKLTPLYPTNKRKSNSVVWVCKCDCGKEVEIRADKLNPNSKYSTKSCGCLLGAQLKIGQRFGRLTIISSITASNQSQNKLWKCKCDCGNDTSVTSNALLSGRTKSCGCLAKEQSRINGKNTKRVLDGQKFGKLLVLKDSEQRTKQHDVLWECLCDCGNKTLVSTNHLTSGHVHSCGCSNSKGNSRIAQILTNLNIVFYREQTFKGCTFSNKNKLRFDFYLPDYNCCIEYDGIQHFEINAGWNTPEKFERTKKSDGIKNKYCQENNIKLIRIPYYDFKKLNEQYILERIV